jgi:hypothetical protein
VAAFFAFSLRNYHVLSRQLPKCEEILHLSDTVRRPNGMIKKLPDDESQKAGIHFDRFRIPSIRRTHRPQMPLLFLSVVTLL